MLLMKQTIEVLNMKWDLLIDFSLAAVRVYYKFEKVSTIPNPKTGILGARNRFIHCDTNPTSEKK